MAWIWSDPTPQPSVAMEQAQAHLSAPDIGRLVMGIMESREREKALQQKQMEDISNSIRQAGQQKDAGAAADFARSGYMDDSDAAINPNQQAIYDKASPAARALMMSGLKSSLDDVQNNEYKEAEARRANAQAVQFENDPFGENSTDPSVISSRKQRQAVAAANSTRQTAMAVLGTPDEGSFRNALAQFDRYQPGDPKSKTAAAPGNSYPVVPNTALTAENAANSNGVLKQHQIDAVRIYRDALSKVDGSPMSPPTAPTTFIVGKQYTDKNGNTATYQADGTWK